MNADNNIHEWEEIFQLVDKDHGGSISKDELEVLMKTLRVQMTSAELDAMVAEIDHEGTGEINFEAFYEAMTDKKLRNPVKREDLIRAFSRFIGHEEEGIHFDEFIEILTKYGDEDKRLSYEEAVEKVSQITHQKKGLIDIKAIADLYLQK